MVDAGGANNEPHSLRLKALLGALRHDEMSGHSAAVRPHAGRAVKHSATGSKIDHQPRPLHVRLAPDQLDVPDERDQLAVEIIDSEIAFRGLRQVVDSDIAAGINPVDLGSAIILLVRRIGDGETRRIGRQISLSEVDVAD